MTVDRRRRLELEVDVLEAEAALALRRAGIAGTVALLEHDAAAAHGWRRPLFPWEHHALLADTLEDLDGQARRLARQLAEDRAHETARLAAWVAAQERTTLAAMLMADPMRGPYAAGETGDAILDDLGAFLDRRRSVYRDELAGVYRDGWGRIVAEARRQGVPVPTFAPNLDEAPTELLERIDREAGRLVRSPYNALVQAADDRLHAPGSALWDPEEAGRQVADAGAQMSERSLDDQARRGVNTVEGLGATDAAKVLPEPARIYASELMDANTCGPCSHIDGREYATEAASLQDYPAGRYVLCEGGDRCRGTRVFVWPDEAEPTLRNPGDTPPPTPPPGGYPEPPGPSTPPATQPPPTVDRAEWTAELDQVLADAPTSGRWARRADGSLAGTDHGDRYGTWLPDGDAVAQTEVIRRAGAVVERRARTLAGERLPDLEGEVGRIADELEQLQPLIDEVAAPLRDAHDGLVAATRARREELQAQGLNLVEAAEQAQRDTAHLRQATKALDDRYTELTDQRLRLRRARAEAEDQARRIMADARLKALAEHRPMGGTLDLHDGAGRTVANVEGRELIGQAARHYPTEWIDRSNRMGPVVASATSRRAFHRALRMADDRVGSYIEVPAGRASAANTALHELGHRMELVTPDLGRLEWAYHRSRTRGPSGSPERMRRLKSVEGAGYRDDELTRPDEYPDSYSGKEYRRGADRDLLESDRIGHTWELFTTGVESVLGTSRYADDGMVEFVLGVLAGL